MSLSQGRPRQLKVIAKLSTGIEDDVTKYTKFESLDPSVAEVDADGKVASKLPGDTAVLAHYAGQVGFATILVPNAPNRQRQGAERNAPRCGR